MVELPMDRALLARAAIAIVVACLFALQGFAFSMSRHSASAKAPSELLAVYGAAICGVDTQGGFPATNRGDHSRCCILCPHAGPLDSADPTGPRVEVPAASPAAGLARRRFDDFDAPPPARTRAWSSRAPPHFS